MDERELDRLAYEAEHDYDFRLAALVRQLREHRTMLRRYLIAHAAAAKAGTRQFSAASNALIAAYTDALALLEEPALKIPAESFKGAAVARLAANGGASSVTNRSRS